MRSMTGYGQADGASERYRVAVWLRSVNSRHLDLALRLRDEYVGSEPSLRRLMMSRLARGRVDVAVEITPLLPAPPSVRIREEVVRALRAQVDRLAEAGLVHGELAPGDLLQLQEVVELQPAASDWGDDEERLLLEVAGGALDELVRSREQEGEKLHEAIASRRQELSHLLQTLSERRDEVRSTLHRALRERVETLLGEQGLDPQRLHQEVAMLVERSDVAEELDRLAAHLEHLETVALQDGAVGRRLDFVIQEMVRELNTLGAKCRDAAAAHLVVEAKLLCEQLREQVQNVE